MPEREYEVPPSATSKWNVHRFTKRIGQAEYVYQVLKMQDSLFIHIGNAQKQTLHTLSVGVPTNPEPLSTKIFGGTGGDEAKSMAHQFAACLKKQVFISFDAPPMDELRPEIIKFLKAEIELVPNAF